MNIPQAGIQFYNGTQGQTGSTFSGSHSALTDLAYPSSGHTGIVPFANLPWDNQQRNFLPTDLGAGLVEWWRGDLGIGLTGAEITAWTGQKNGYVWAKLVGVDAPTVGSGINSLPTVKFNGTSQVLVNGSLGSIFSGAARPYMVFIVFKRLSSSTQYIWMQGDGTYSHILCGYHGNGYIFHQRYIHTNYNTTVGINQSGTTNPTMVTFFTDRAQTGSTPLPTITGRESGKTLIDRLDWTHGGNTRTMQYGILGALANGPTYASRSGYANVEIAEIILLSVPETEIVISLVEQYLVARYALKGYEGTPLALATPVGTVREIGSGLTFAVLDTDHHLVLKPTAAASAANLPPLNNTTKFREYLFTRDVQSAPTSTFPANVVASGTDTIKLPNGTSVSTYSMYGKQESIRLKGATNFSVSPFYYWQVVGSPPENEYSVGLLINSLTAKTTPADADMVGLMDSADSNLLKKLSWSNIKAKIGAYINARTRLTDHITYYVRTDGNDSNDGSANDAAHAWLTPQHAIDFIRDNLDGTGYNVDIQLGDGTYSNANEVIAINNLSLSSARVTIKGNAVTPTNVVLSGGSDAIAIFNQSTLKSTSGVHPTELGLLTIQDLKVVSTNRNGIYVENSWIAMKGVDFGACGLAHMRVCRNGLISVIGDYTISGDADFHYDVEYGGTIAWDDDAAPFTVTATGTRAFTIFAFAANEGWLLSAGVTYSGTYTGSRYQAFNGAIIDVTGETYFPGDVSGLVTDAFYGGVWNPVRDHPFSAGEFTASGSMTWTVDSGDVATFKYQINGRVMTVWLTISTSTTGGTADTTLSLVIPYSKTAAATVVGFCHLNDPASGGHQTGKIYSVSGDTHLYVKKTAEGNFGLDTNALSVQAVFSFPISA